MERPNADEYVPYYDRYISLVTEDDVLALARDQVEEVRRFAAAIPRELEEHRYAPGKWSVREVFGHLIDVERVHAYRAFAIARGETKDLPGFEPDDFAAESGAGAVALRDLVEELVQERLSNVSFLARLSPRAWRRIGTADGKRISVRALAYILPGHIKHHLRLLRELYGVGEAGNPGAGAPR